MNDAIETLTIGCSISMLFGTILGFFAFIRYLRYRETIALAERGLIQSTDSENGNGRNTLRWGVVILFLGMALCIGTWPIGFLIDPVDSYTVPLDLGPWMLLGLIPMFFGLALITLYFINRSDDRTISPGIDAEDEVPTSKFTGEE